MSLTKVKIISEKQGFFEDLLVFLNQKSSFFKREFNITNILNEHVSPLEFIKKNSPISVDGVFGSTYQSSFRKNEQIYEISHDVVSIGIDDSDFFAYVSSSKYGNKVNFHEGVLRPVYYKKDNKSYLIATFDVDFNISEI